MKVYVGDIRERPGAQVEFDETGPCPGAEALPDGEAHCTCTGPVRVSGRVLNVGGQLLVQGRVSAEVEGSCSRCLAPVRRRVEADFVERFRRGDPAGGRPRAGSEAGPGGDERGLEDGEPLRSYTGDTLSLDDVVREVMVLNLPMRVLCREDCAGLCPRCGRNRNTDPCQCPSGDVDPRLAVLSQWRKGKAGPSEPES